MTTVRLDTEIFRCTRVIPDCPVVIQAPRRAELLARVLEHMHTAHRATPVGPLMEKAIASIESNKDLGYYQGWSTRRIDFLIVTALEKEFAPLSEIFKGMALPKALGDPNRYEEAVVQTALGFMYTVRLLCVGDQGPAHTAGVLAMALRALIPRYVIMTGIAATVPGEGRRVGNLLIATHLVDLSDRKIWPSHIEFRHRTYYCDRELRLETGRFLRKSILWRRLARDGAIISQTDLIKSAAHRNKLVTLLKETEPGLKPIGIEKEGAGVAISADIQTSDLKPGILMIKGAVDFANYHKRDATQRAAARRSAQFLYDFLSSAPVGVPSFEVVNTFSLEGARERDSVYGLFQELGDRRLLCHSHGTWEYPKAMDSLERMRASITKALARLGPDWSHRKLLENARAALQDFETLLEREMQEVGWESVPSRSLVESAVRMRDVIRQSLQILANAYSLTLPDVLD
jgi:predicted small metal-binding protein/nucleoside phosphorylase